MQALADEVAELTVLRKLLERVTVSTARRARAEDIAALEAAIERQAQHVDEPEQMVLDAEIFAALGARCTGSGGSDGWAAVLIVLGRHGGSGDNSWGLVVSKDSTGV